MGLHHGPIHAECRVNDLGVFVLEIAARPIGGLCARALRFVRRDAETPTSGPAGSRCRSRSCCFGTRSARTLQPLWPRGVGLGGDDDARAGARPLSPHRGRRGRECGPGRRRRDPHRQVKARCWCPCPEGHSYPGLRLRARGAARGRGERRSGPPTRGCGSCSTPRGRSRRGRDDLGEPASGVATSPAAGRSRAAARRPRRRRSPPCAAG